MTDFLASFLGAPASPAAPLATVVAATAIAATTTIDFSTLALPLLGHQEEAVARIHHDVAAFGGSYVGDEMGIGKTFAAIAAVALASNAYPCLVIVPPSLRLNWRNEIARLVPGARVEVLTSTKATLPAPADFYVLGDSTLTAWAGFVKADKVKGTPDKVTGVLTRMGIRALIVDEAHRFKRFEAQRSKAAIAFAATLPTGALRVLLSGTAVENKPQELSTQIQIAGVDRVFGGWGAFLGRYCPKIDSWGTRGSAHLAELHQKMVDTFYLRRTREQVLTLPGKGRTTIATPMAGKAAREYLAAQEDLIAYVRGSKGRKAAEVASKAEALVLLTTLRRLVGEAKVEAIIDYVQALVDEGEQVFIAAHHKPVVAALRDAFGAVTITGSDSDTAKQAAVEAFQAGTARVLVGNLRAAGVGFTLTAAKHVVIAELPFTYSALCQVEDRLDRIGQTRKVVSHVMLGANGIPTVDQRLMGILETKAALTGMIHDGVEASVIDDESVQDALLDSYRDG